MTLHPVTYRTDEGVIRALVTEGRKWARYISMEGTGIRWHRIKLAETKYMRPFDYPTAQFAARLLAAGQRFGITQSAARALAECLEGTSEPTARVEAICTICDQPTSACNCTSSAGWSQGELFA